MTSWLDLEHRFRDLAEPLKGCVIDYQRDDKGWESWSLRGGAAADQRSFEALCDMAGALLTKFPPPSVYPEILAVADARSKWYRALMALTGPHQEPAIGTEQQDGKLIRNLWLGTVLSPVAFSAALALRFHSETMDLGPHILPAAPPVRRSLAAWLEKERQVRGTIWLVIATFAALVLAALAL